MKLATILWQLQLIDQEFDGKTKRAHQVDEALASDPAIAAARAADDVAQKKLGAARGALHQSELEAQSLDAKLKEIDARLYSGKVTNPKELDSLSQDLAMHKRNRSALDDKLLAAMEQIDQAQTHVRESSQVLEQIETKRAGELDHLTSERDALTARLAELDAERNSIRAALASDMLKTYDRLHQTKAGRAVAQIYREACSVCGNAIPTGVKSRMQSGDEIVTCPSCGRILAP